LCFRSQAKDAAKSGLVLFHEAMDKFRPWKLEESFVRFERAAAKGHEESIFILSLVQDAEMEESALIEAFAKMEEPLGWYFAGRLSDGREQFDYYKKSAEGGCTWGQVKYGWYFKFVESGGEFVEKDNERLMEWMEKAANQNNPWAMECLGEWFRDEGDDRQKAVSLYRAAAELGWKSSMESLAEMLRSGHANTKDLREAAIWSAKGGLDRVLWDRVFWALLRRAKRELEGGSRQELDYNFDQLCYSLGWGLYWYLHNAERDDEFEIICLDYYCSCVELQRKSIFTFLLFWNQTTVVKGPGQMIAQMVWEGREDNLTKDFEENDGDEAEEKKIKK
jgi:hypothetical protein